MLEMRVVDNGLATLYPKFLPPHDHGMFVYVNNFVISTF